MATKVILPKVDMDQESGTIVEWLKENGETVTIGEPILVIETDKVAIDVESPATGVIDGIRAEVGEQLPIGTVIAYILAPGEALPSIEKLEESTKTIEKQPTAAHPTVDPSTTEISPVALRMAQAKNIDLSKIKGSGVRGRITKRDIEAAVHNRLYISSEGVNATPKARVLARELSVELSQVKGSGPSGRIQAEDITSFSTKAISIDPGDEVIPLVGMRRTIAERMTSSYQSAPHINFTMRVDMTSFENARAVLAGETGPGTRISMTALFVQLLANVLRKHPLLNSSLIKDRIVMRHRINIGVAVALENGLIVPVIMNADQKSLAEISEETADLVKRARENRLNPNDVKGGTFTLTNLGPFGIEQFTAIINPGQAAILAVGSIQEEVIPIDGKPQIRPVVRMTLSADHRIVDGAVAAQFMGEYKQVLEAISFPLEK
jgi:pyruvate dehydrogenase E2 component (dihydrolipoamide acetyltransferase)